MEVLSYGVLQTGRERPKNGNFVARSDCCGRHKRRTVPAACLPAKRGIIFNVNDLRRKEPSPRCRFVRVKKKGKEVRG